MRQKLKRTLLADERGMASVIVSVILILIMSLIVLGMSQNTRREQRQTLDRQLSDQAFYNAESGINDVKSYIFTNSSSPIDKTNCNTTPALTGVIEGVNSYTCALYDKAPKEIILDSVSTTTPVNVPLLPTAADGVNPQGINEVTISWDDAENKNLDFSSNPPGCNFSASSDALPPSCPYGGVRLELLSPTHAAPTRDTIQQSTMIGFLLPNSGTGDNNGQVAAGTFIYPNNQGFVSHANCSNTGPSADNSKRRCFVTLTNLAGRTNMYLSLRSLYRKVNVTVFAGTYANQFSNTVRLKNAQTMIDVTGKANDVLRRVQVRTVAVDASTSGSSTNNGSSSSPGFAIQSRDSICKVLSVVKTAPGTGTVNSDDSLCELNPQN